MTPEAQGLFLVRHCVSGAATLSGLTHGLSGMRHRVLAIGGHFEMVSNPSQGVLIRALIPLDVVANSTVEIESQHKLKTQSQTQILSS